MGHINPVEDSFRGCDLVRPHHHQHLLAGENTVFAQNIQNGVPGEESSCKVDQIRDRLVFCVCPVGGELKAVAGFAFSGRFVCCFLDGIKTCAVGVILGFRAVGYNKNLHIFKQPAARPERISLIPLNLVESLPDGNTSPFQLHMHKRKAVYQYRHIIAVVVVCPLGFADDILVDHLQAVVLRVFPVDETDVFGHCVITPENLNVIFLHHPGFVRDLVIRVCDYVIEKPFPFRVGKGIVIQLFQLLPQVGNQVSLFMNRQVGIALLTEHTDKLLLQCSF